MAQTTWITIALDRSGSMLKSKDATIKGFNNWLDITQIQSKKDGLATNVSILFFNDTVEMPVDGVPIEEVNVLDETRFKCRGNTSLHDTIAEAIHSTADKASHEDRVLVIVVTDGRDTSSKEYTAEMVRTIIQEKEDLGNWTFVYLSSDPYAFQDSKGLGISAGNTRAFTRANYDTGGVWGQAAGATRDYMAAPQPATTDFWNPGDAAIGGWNYYPTITTNAPVEDQADRGPSVADIAREIAIVRERRAQQQAAQDAQRMARDRNPAGLGMPEPRNPRQG